MDSDERRFPAELLVQWRTTAEALAREDHGKPVSHVQTGNRKLMLLVRRMPGAIDGLVETVAEFLRDVAADEAWGGHYELGRMTLYELALNAVRHGGASSLELEAREHMVCLRDNGVAFGLRQLRSGGRGGHRALLDLETHAAGSFSLRWTANAGVNEWTLVDDIATGGVDVPCSATLKSARQTIPAMRALQDCEEIHVYVHPLASYSDLYLFLEAAAGDRDARPLIFHGLPEESRLRALVTEWLPSATFSP